MTVASNHEEHPLTIRDCYKEAKIRLKKIGFIQSILLTLSFILTVWIPLLAPSALCGALSWCRATETLGKASPTNYFVGFKNNIGTGVILFVRVFVLVLVFGVIGAAIIGGTMGIMIVSGLANMGLQSGWMEYIPSGILILIGIIYAIFSFNKILAHSIHSCAFIALRENNPKDAMASSKVLYTEHKSPSIKLFIFNMIGPYLPQIIIGLPIGGLIGAFTFFDVFGYSTSQVNGIMALCSLILIIPWTLKMIANVLMTTYVFYTRVF